MPEQLSTPLLLQKLQGLLNKLSSTGGLSPEEAQEFFTHAQALFNRASEPVAAASVKDAASQFVQALLQLGIDPTAIPGGEAVLAEFVNPQVGPRTTVERLRTQGEKAATAAQIFGTAGGLSNVAEEIFGRAGTPAPTTTALRQTGLGVTGAASSLTGDTTALRRFTEQVLEPDLRRNVLPSLPGAVEATQTLGQLAQLTGEVPGGVLPETILRFLQVPGPQTIPRQQYEQGLLNLFAQLFGTYPDSEYLRQRLQELASIV